MWRVKYVSVHALLSYEEQTEEFEVQHIYEMLGVFKFELLQEQNLSQDPLPPLE